MKRGYRQAFLAVFLLFFSISSVSWADNIPLEKSGGVYFVPVELNGFLKLNFIIDTGSADVSLPSDVVMALVRSGTLKTEDFLEGRTYTLADGSLVRSPRFILKSVKLGNRILRNVPASVSETGGHLLLGQSLLEQFGSYTFDNRNQLLVLHGTPSEQIDTKVPSGESLIPLVARNHSVLLDGPELAVRAFFMAVAEERFEECWRKLSTYSKNQIVRMVSEEAETSPEMVRRLFDANHHAVAQGFWRSFRNSSRIPLIVPLATYHSLSETSGLAMVEVKVGEEILKFEVYEENGKWKLGLIESIKEFNGFLKQSHE